MAPGSIKGLQLVVADIDAARADLASRGVEVSPVQHHDGSGMVDGRGDDWNSFVFFADPDGNTWAVQESRRFARRRPGARRWPSKRADCRIDDSSGVSDEVGRARTRGYGSRRRSGGTSFPRRSVVGPPNAPRDVLACGRDRAAGPDGDAPGVSIRSLPTDSLSPDEIEVIRALLDAAFWDDEDERFTQEDWEHSIGGLHVVLDLDGRIVSHASVVQRELQVAGHTLRTGYVEAVATAPASRVAATGRG
jgi:hypothetical protein